MREIKTADGTGDMDTARYQDVSTNYSFSVTADGRLVVSHAVVDGIDGTDQLRNIERLQFTDGSYAIIMGTEFNDNGGSGANDRPVLNGTTDSEIIIGLAGSDILNGNGGNDVMIGGTDGPSSTFADDFNGTASYTDNNGTAAFTGGWTETGDVCDRQHRHRRANPHPGQRARLRRQRQRSGERGCADPAFAQPERGERGHSQLLV